MDMRWQYLGWDRPFSLLVAERLRALRAAGEPLDSRLIWVPSGRAGRHLLSELFLGGEEGAEAFHPPRLVTPAQFVRGLLDGQAEVASDSQCLFTWKTVLEAAPAHRLAPLFPVVPEEQKLGWTYAMARQLMALRSRLGEDGQDMARLASRPGLLEAARWRALAQLETEYEQQLGSLGLTDPLSWLEAHLEEAVSGRGYAEVQVAGVLNVSRLQGRCLEALGRAGCTVCFLVPAPAERAADFDELGRPRPGLWEREPLSHDLLAERLQRAPDPRALVNGLLDLASRYGEAIDDLVVGAPDPEEGRYLIERSRLTKTPFYAPEGRSMQETDWGRFLLLIEDWQKRPTLETLSAFLGHAHVRAWMRRGQMDPNRAEAALSIIRKEQLFHEMEQLRSGELFETAHRTTVLEAAGRLDRLAGNLAGEVAGFADWVWGLLQEMTKGAQLSADSWSVIDHMEEILQDLQAEFGEIPVSWQDQWELLRFRMETTPFYPEREAEERPVSGWLELPWETAPHLVVLGLPDAAVPGPKSLDAFLAPALCREVPLYGPDDLAAFHAFRLRLLLESRRHWGRLDLLLPDRGLADEPVRPCRFLFLASEEEILERIDLLLGERASPSEPLGASFGGRLHLPDPPPLERLPVTGFRAYLENPFHFFLGVRNRWRPPESLPAELGALEFGTLAHAALEQLNASAEGSKLIKLSDIEDFLMASLEVGARGRLGSRLTVPLQIQMEAMRERLRAAAGHIAVERLAGWIPEQVEYAFGREDPPLLVIEGIAVSGKIDLMERHQETGALRIVDYKTSDSPDTAVAAHRKAINAASREALLPESVFSLGNKPFRWVDLQLPLYQWAVECLTGEQASVAHFNLAKAVSDTGLSQWVLEPGEIASARACAAAIVRHVKAGHFPLTDSATFDDPWAGWFGSQYAEALDPDWQARYGRDLS